MAGFNQPKYEMAPRDAEGSASGSGIEKKSEALKNKESAKGKLDSLKTNVETQNVIQEHKLGKNGARLSQEEKDSMPKLEKGSYTVEAGVNKLGFKQTVRDYNFYLVMSQTARHMLKDFDHIHFVGFPSIKKNKHAIEKIKAAIIDISHAAIDGAIADEGSEARKFKDSIDKNHMAQDIYGSEGAFNLILAYGRAQDEASGVPPESQDSIQYRLFRGNKRFSRLLGKKETAREANERLDLEGYNTQMQEFYKRKSELNVEINIVARRGMISKEEADGFRSRLKDVIVDTLTPGQKVPANAREMYVEIAKTIQGVRKDFDAAKKAHRDATAKPTEAAADLPKAPTLTALETLVSKVLTRSPLKDQYEAKDDSPEAREQLAYAIAKEAVASLRLSAGRDIITNFAQLVAPLILAALNNADRENRAKNTPSRIFTLDAHTKARIFTVLLGEMKKYSIKSDTVMEMER